MCIYKCETCIDFVRVNSIDLSNDHSATGIGLPGRKPQMVKGFFNARKNVFNNLTIDFYVILLYIMHIATSVLYLSCVI